MWDALAVEYWLPASLLVSFVVPSDASARAVELKQNIIQVWQGMANSPFGMFAAASPPTDKQTDMKTLVGSKQRSQSQQQAKRRNSTEKTTRNVKSSVANIKTMRKRSGGTQGCQR